MFLRFLAAALLLAVASGARADETLSAGEVEKLLSGNSTKGVIVIESPLLNHEFQRFFAADGTLVSRNVTKGESDKGVWRVTPQGSVCMKHDGGREYCTLVVRTRGGYQRVFKGKPSEAMAVLPGDAFALKR